MQPVSVVVTELNEGREIERAVESLLAQQPPATEVIVVDGGSTDGTWEWLQAAASRDRRLVAIRDESCNLKHSLGPVSRGRNVAIAAASSPIVACADAGCAYAPDWLANLTAPLASGQAEYALGGSQLDPGNCTVWDIASAPFFSVKLEAVAPTKSCTARSMAFTKSLWAKIGGFPEQVLVGEDTLFDLEARRLTEPAFVANAKALYGPRNSFYSACHQLARYATSDGQARVRWKRLLRNAARCLVDLAALASLRWTVMPLLVILALHGWFAFFRDWPELRRRGWRAVLARFAFSSAVPWVIAVNHLRGLLSGKRLTNWQNDGSAQCAVDSGQWIVVCRGCSGARRHHVKQNRKIMRDAAGQHEQVPGGVEVGPAIEGIKDDAERVSQASGGQPEHSLPANGVDQRANYEDRQPALNQIDRRRNKG
jgi:glycosyltransferase involved in cell wall biosynthesis